MRKHIIGCLGILGLLLAACGPAATPTPTRLPLASTATVTVTRTPTLVPAGGTALAAPTPGPTAMPTKAPVGPKYGGILSAKLRTWLPAWDFHRWFTGARELRVLQHSAFNAIAMKASTGRAPCEADITADIAENWKWVDDTTFDLKIYKGINFQNKPPVNGREMTSDDVVWSWKRILAVNPRMDFFANQVKDIAATDRYTVRFRTKAPVPWIMSALGFGTTSSIVARESGDYSRDREWGDWESPEKTWIGSGPFMFVQATTAVKVVMERNPNYWRKGLPYLDGLVFLNIPDMSTRMAAVVAGKLELWWTQVPIATAAALEKTAPWLQIQGCPFENPQVIFMRTDQPPFSDIRVRRAVRMALDQDALIKSVFQGRAWPSAALPPLHPWYLKAEDFPPELRQNLQYNPQEASRLLAEAGYPQGLDTEFMADPRKGSPFNELSEATVEMLRQVGIRAKLRMVTPGEWATTMSSGDYKGMQGGWASDIDNPYLHLAAYYSKTPTTSNKGHVNDPKLDSLIDAFMFERDEAKAKDVLRQIQYRLLEQVYLPVSPSHFDFSIAQPYVKGFVKGGAGAMSRWWTEVVWLDK